MELVGMYLNLRERGREINAKKELEKDKKEGKERIREKEKKE